MYSDTSVVFGMPYHSSKPWSVGKRPCAIAQVPFAEDAGGVTELGEESAMVISHCVRP